MSASDPASAPAWAVEMASEYGSEFMYSHRVQELALLLASVREGALREAAGIVATTARMDICDLLLSTLATPPEEAS